MATGYIMLDTPNPYTAQGGFPRRGGYVPSGTCIVHTSEGAWTAGVDSLTNLVRSRRDYGCYHRACDWQDIALYYPWEWECWQDSETNNWAVGIAAACRTTDWDVMPADIREGFYRNMARMAADFVVYMRDTYAVAVPLRRLTGDEARAGVPGFCAHGDSGIARSDPGAQFDWALFFRYIQESIGGILPQGTTQKDDDMTPEEKALLFGVLDKLNARTATLPGQKDELRYWSDLIGAVDKINGGVADLQSRPAADIAAQLNAAGMAVAVRDELVKLISGKGNA